MLNLLDATCTSCEDDFYVTLPSDHALLAPVSINTQTKEVFNPSAAAWLGDLLALSLSQKSAEYIPIQFTRSRRFDRIVLVNCLDYLYGHCLLKLLNVQYYLEHEGGLACCVLIPKQLTHLVPAGVAEIWAVDLPLKRFRTWFTSLQEQIANEISAREVCFLGIAHSHPHFSRYDLSQFVKQHESNALSRDTTRVVFAYREDRLWGSSLRRQHRNINQLFDELRLGFPRLEFSVVGLGSTGVFNQGVHDCRAVIVSLESEQRWLATFANADCVVGVHGSNMLLPSGLARHVVELVPEDRLGNLTQDLLWPSESACGNEALYRVRFLYGDSDLRDLHPYRVATIIINQIGFAEGFRIFNTASQMFNTDGQDREHAVACLSTASASATSAYVHLLERYRARRLAKPLSRMRTHADRLLGSASRAVHKLQR